MVREVDVLGGDGARRGMRLASVQRLNSERVRGPGLARTMR